jgi:hypothetical protein
MKSILWAILIFLGLYLVVRLLGYAWYRSKFEALHSVVKKFHRNKPNT